MDLALEPREEALRDEVRAFVRDNLPESIRRRMIAGTELSNDDRVVWQRLLNARGWGAPHWPVEYGGTGWSELGHYVFQHELQAAPAPMPHGYGVELVGPVIIAVGSDWQKRHFLPRILNLDDWWSQGFSEPGAGSDLASIRTSARRDGDVYVVNGQKAWTSYAHYGDWIFCLVRTGFDGKPQAGISFLLIDLRSPGVEIRPVITIDGLHEVNDVFFDDVRVPVENLVGEENRGWDYAKALLGRERTGSARIGMLKERLRHIRRVAADMASDTRPDPAIDEQIVALEVGIQALELTVLRMLACEKGAASSGSLQTILKTAASELLQKESELLLKVAGPHALRYVPDQLGEGWNAEPIGPDWAAAVAPVYFNWRKHSIFAGSNEIQRGIIAKSVLGL